MQIQWLIIETEALLDAVGSNSFQGDGRTQLSHYYWHLSDKWYEDKLLFQYGMLTVKMPL